MTLENTPSVQIGIKHTKFGSYDPKWKSDWEIAVDTKIEDFDLVGCVKRFFELLDKVETSDEGREFRPNYISSCRCLDGAELGKLIEKMKRLTNEHASSRD